MTDEEAKTVIQKSFDIARSEGKTRTNDEGQEVIYATQPEALDFIRRAERALADQSSGKA